MTLTKAELRQAARETRKVVAYDGFAAQLARYAPTLDIAPGTVVGGYHAISDEADPALLLAALAEQGCRIAFPRVAAKDAALEFHRVPAGEILQPGSFGVHEPLSHWPKVMPSVLLVPLLAFDAHGHRLGYGVGYYDRTLAALKNIRAIGIAYAGQEVKALPREAHDHPLDGVLTEKGLYQIKGTNR